ncbi:EpsG family protein [uncultured Pantoea sp.]|uniref:EpsG family protein n=1 Tax=uncultured Pantoea sp. TaxID=218084 RepID=UPI0025F7189B|nr:EpsG family protein [uncultured Pantoea sp.]
MFNLITIAFGLITPLFALVLIPVIRNKKSLSLLFAAILTSGMIFFQPLPGFDLLVHYQNFMSYQEGAYDLFNRYIGVDILIYIITGLGLSKNTLVFVTSFLLFYSSLKFVENKVHSNNIFMVFTLIVLSYPLVLLISGVRFSIALSFFLMLDVNFYKKRFVLSALSGLFAIIFHYAFAPLIGVYFLFKLLRLNRINTKLLFYFLLFIFPLVFYQEFMIKIISILVEYLGVEKYVGLDLSRYVSGDWGAMRSAHYNLNGLVGYFLPKILLCLLGFVYLITSKQQDSFIIGLFTIVILLFNFGDIGDRYAICLIPFLITASLKEKAEITINKFPLCLLFIVTFVFINVIKEWVLYGEVYMGILTSTLFLNSPLLVLFSEGI